MTAIQIGALIALFLLSGLIYWSGYRTGKIDGRSKSIKEEPSTQGKGTIDLIHKIQTERICLTWEYEGGCHIWRYWDSDEPCDKAYGNTIQEALDALDTPRC
ncbi:hypothetical protein SAMN04488483_0100 [Pseudomonas helmanticensis]|uniref:Uncharacterized protein n=1 Tax=Pseudomonas helmanticensis TaxID=1471381 RepID=A0ACD2TZ79_9PSED|nr:hypothetical protein [Pseudomonas helmanticensis]SMQ22103.1 hypothetical protein SAMN04488483_0100 [Pseudomonas helmanticensis]